jgi:hypothetical protein
LARSLQFFLHDHRRRTKMLIAGAALGLMQTAVAALRPNAPSVQPQPDAEPKATGKAGTHPLGKARPPLSDALQAMLNQASPVQRSSSVGQALKAYVAGG